MPGGSQTAVARRSLLKTPADACKATLEGQNVYSHLQQGLLAERNVHQSAVVRVTPSGKLRLGKRLSLLSHGLGIRQPESNANLRRAEKSQPQALY